MTNSGRQRSNRNMNRIIDLMMILLLPLLMAYSLIGETFHEIIGTVMFVLFIAHLILHRRWWKVVPKGRYNAYRIFITILNMILLILMLFQPLSGIALSKYLYRFLPLTGIASQARSIHMALAYWCYVLMSVHLGLHMDMVIRAMSRTIKRRKIIGWIAGIIIWLISAYGIYAFIHRGFPGYMFMRTRFAFFDFGEPRILFFADYLTIMILFAAGGYYAGKMLKKNREVHAE